MCSTFIISALCSILTNSLPSEMLCVRKFSWMEEPGGLQSMESLRVRHDWATSLSFSTFMHWHFKFYIFLDLENSWEDSIEDSYTSRREFFPFHCLTWVWYIGPNSWSNTDILLLTEVHNSFRSSQFFPSPNPPTLSFWFYSIESHPGYHISFSHYVSLNSSCL